MEPKIISETPVSMSELKSEIEKIKKREEEPSIRVTKMEDYLNSFKILPIAKHKELVEALQKLEVPRLRIEHIFKIADTLPESVDDLDVIMQGYTVSVTKENKQKIADTVKKVA